MRARRRKGVHRVDPVHREDPAAEVAGGARAKRTAKKLCMTLTLDVSQFSGWLNAAAPCQVEREAWEEGGRVRRRLRREDPTAGVGSRARAERT